MDLNVLYMFSNNKVLDYIDVGVYSMGLFDSVYSIYDMIRKKTNTSVYVTFIFPLSAKSYAYLCVRNSHTYVD